eukprot:TRINITY_DN14310_c0_g1_i1.p1 TRINITY_DN14310_c0_g1~~TRINITY_DN14310_c0_g1_i1.p1  ORF type:complete len:215 (+),score=25.65 TRINITY_DN14310_c0_g1_i1:180-824(+)
MAADVSSPVRVLGGYKEDQLKSEASNGKAKGLITRDLLGGCSKELDLDLHVPVGWEKLLDLKSGKIYLQHCSASSPDQNQKPSRQLQDLNFPPSSKSNLPEESLDLKLVSSTNYQSVCTLEKVKSALERAEKVSSTKRAHSTTVSPSTSSPSSSSCIKGEEGEEKSGPSDLLFAAGCPGCLFYVLISKGNPRCPKCDSVVPFPRLKKTRIDLNT